MEKLEFHISTSIRFTTVDFIDLIFPKVVRSFVPIVTLAMGKHLVPAVSSVYAHQYQNGKIDDTKTCYLCTNYAVECSYTTTVSNYVLFGS